MQLIICFRHATTSYNWLPPFKNMASKSKKKTDNFEIQNQTRYHWKFQVILGNSFKNTIFHTWNLFGVQCLVFGVPNLWKKSCSGNSVFVKKCSFENFVLEGKLPVIPSAQKITMRRMYWKSFFDKGKCLLFRGIQNFWNKNPST